jgi:hypothetical protein
MHKEIKKMLMHMWWLISFHIIGHISREIKHVYCMYCTKKNDFGSKTIENYKY